MKDMSIRLRVALLIVVLLAIAGGGVLWAVQSLYSTTVEQMSTESVAVAARGFENLQKQDVDKLSAALSVLLTRDDLREAYTAGDREQLQSLSQPLFEDLKTGFGVTHWYYETTEASPTVFLRVHRPEQYDDALKRKTYLGAVERKDFFGGLELGKTAFALRVVHPYYGSDGTLIGYLELGEEIDHFFDVMKEQSGDDVGLVLLKERLSAEDWATMRENQGKANDWDANAEVVLANSTSESLTSNDLEVDVAELRESGTVFAEETIDGRTYVRGAFPVLDAAGDRVGAVIVKHDATKMLADLQKVRLTALVVLIGVGLAIIAAVLLSLNSLVFARLNAMIASMEDASLRVMGGDFGVTMPEPKRGDEIGTFERHFGEFMGVVTKTLEHLSKR